MFDYEMKRKNCRVPTGHPEKYTRGTCDDSKAGSLRGTDPNRNYGGLWGGSGASPSWADDTFRGDAPFSEPEVQNIRELIASRQVTNLITNHTYSNLVLRPPGVADFGFPLDEPAATGRSAPLADAQRLLERSGLRPLRHDRHRPRTGVLVHGRLRFTFEIGPDGSTRRTRGAWRPSTSAWPRRRAPARAATGRRTTRCSRPPPTAAALRDRGRGACRLNAADIEDVPDVDLARVAGRLRQRHPRPDSVHRHADLRAEDDRADSRGT